MMIKHLNWPVVSAVYRLERIDGGRLSIGQRLARTYYLIDIINNYTLIMALM